MDIIASSHCVCTSLRLWINHVPNITPLGKVLTIQVRFLSLFFYMLTLSIQKSSICWLLIKVGGFSHHRVQTCSVALSILESFKLASVLPDLGPACCFLYHMVMNLMAWWLVFCSCLTGYSTLRPEVEEGICQVLAHMWLDSEIFSGSGSHIASSSSSSSSSTSSKKGTRSQFERKLGDFFKHQIESDTSAAYGDGFRVGNEAVLRYGLRQTLDHIKLTGSFPYWIHIDYDFDHLSHHIGK